MVDTHQLIECLFLVNKMLIGYSTLVQLAPAVVLYKNSISAKNKIQPKTRSVTLLAL
ncbi:hypothetical protein GLIP_4147 [Aliiglaciecola lipolytica E3]|uniref:Uncharacterized protein n=1 Tax=Aliiglaciecola lipolytica E3 TaxID=1127673 RepID=K6YJG8_9ALTE|nr:hypothetical protein GLIP_4147 [Aliiglaciecola lipolytica E3]